MDTKEILQNIINHEGSCHWVPHDQEVCLYCPIKLALLSRGLVCESSPKKLASDTTCLKLMGDSGKGVCDSDFAKFAKELLEKLVIEQLLLGDADDS